MFTVDEFVCRQRETHAWRRWSAGISMTMDEQPNAAEESGHSDHGALNGRSEVRR
jgi:hypothetical protein